VKSSSRCSTYFNHWPPFAETGTSRQRPYPSSLEGNCNLKTSFHCLTARRHEFLNDPTKSCRRDQSPHLGITAIVFTLDGHIEPNKHTKPSERSIFLFKALTTASVSSGKRTTRSISKTVTALQGRDNAAPHQRRRHTCTRWSFRSEIPGTSRREHTNSNNVNKSDLAACYACDPAECEGRQ
jgi:hypothetical protein